MDSAADVIKEALVVGGLGFVTSVSIAGRNEMTRIFGFYVSEDHAKLTVLVYKEDAYKLLDCLTTTSKVSVMLGDPLTFKCVQVKGECIQHRDATEDEVALIEGPFYNKWNAMMMMFGMPDGFIRVWKYKPTMAIEINCKEFYDQTPHQNTGNKIS